MAEVLVSGRFTVPGNDSPTAINVSATHMTIMRNDAKSAHIFYADVASESADGTVVSKAGSWISWPKLTHPIPAKCVLNAHEPGNVVGYTITDPTGAEVFEAVAPQALNTGGTVQVLP